MHAPDATDSLHVLASWHELQPFSFDAVALSRLIDMQEPPKPKPAPLPVPQLSRAPARPQLPVTEPAQELKTADASDGALSKRAAGNRSKGAPQTVALKPAAEPKPSAPDTLQEAGPIIDAPEAPAISQDSAEAVRESPKPKQAAPVVPEPILEVVPAPQRPTRPRSRAQPIEGASPSISMQEDAAISTKDDVSSAVTAEESERTFAVSTEELPANAHIEATSSVAELEEPSQAAILSAAGDTASAPDALEGPAANVSTSTKAQDNGAGIEMQPAPAPPIALPKPSPAPPMALPKPSLRAPQPAMAFTVRAFFSPRLLCACWQEVSHAVVLQLHANASSAACALDCTALPAAQPAHPQLRRANILKSVTPDTPAFRLFSPLSPSPAAEAQILLASAQTHDGLTTECALLKAR